MTCRCDLLFILMTCTIDVFVLTTWVEMGAREVVHCRCNATYLEVPLVEINFGKFLTGLFSIGKMGSQRPGTTMGCVSYYQRDQIGRHKSPARTVEHSTS